MAIARDATNSTNGTTSTGGNITIDLTAMATGALCFLLVRNTGTVLTTEITTSNWTVRASDTNTHAYVLFSRVKQGGDTTTSFDVPGVANSAYLLEVFTGCNLGTVLQRLDAASGTPMAFDAVTMNSGSASLLFGKASAAGANATPPASYTELQDPTTSVWSGWNTTPGTGSVDPADGTWGGATANRIGVHVELADASVAATYNKQRRMLLGAG